jgi:DNA-binding GntR family transcriptional regulator
MTEKKNIYHNIRNEIVYGNIYPGERLVEKELCDKFNSSRGNVRDALKSLEAEGLVVINRGRGASVAKISHQDRKDLYELLALLEGKSVALAVSSLKSTDFEVLSDINNILRTCGHNPDKHQAIRIWQEENLRFHRYFADRCKNEQLIRMVEEVRWRTFRFRYVYVFVPFFNEFCSQHESIINAAISYDCELARKITEEHVIRGYQILVENSGIVPST